MTPKGNIAGRTGCDDGISRRKFLEVAAASLAAASAASCTLQPEEKIVPYVEQPETMVPGQPMRFATALSHGGYARGVLAESTMGRPIKIHGNPRHPASLGATDIFMEAAILSLYDPHRARGVSQQGHMASLSAFERWLADQLPGLRALGGRGLHFLTGNITSPTFRYQMNRLRETLPEAQWHVYEPALGGGFRQGAMQAFGRGLEPVYRIAQARTILALDANFLSAEPGSLSYARQFIDSRRMGYGASTGMNRLYALESSPTITGAMADHFWSLGPRQIQDAAVHLAKQLQVPQAAEIPTPALQEPPWLKAIAEDLRAAGPKSLVLAGDHCDPRLHALALAINQALGALETTAGLIDPIAAGPADPLHDIQALAQAMREGSVAMLVIIGANPVFTAPADLDFAEALGHVHQCICMSMYPDETALHAHWVLPMAHELEAWGDARAFDGTISIQQPLLAPLMGGISPHTMLSMFDGSPGRASLDLIRDYWQGLRVDEDFEAFWHTALRDGVIEGTAFSAITPPQAPASLRSASSPSSSAQSAEFDLLFRPDPGVWDGRHANNAWLQECPRPLTKLTWDNALILAAGTAERLGLGAEDRVRLEVAGRSLELPVWVMPSHAPGCLTLHFGQGHWRMGPIAESAGFNAYLLRTTRNHWNAPAAIERIGGTYQLASTQTHRRQEGRGAAHRMTYERFLTAPESVIGHHQDPQHPPPSLYPGHAYPNHAWGMSIDLTACIGCNACVIACQAENNIPAVGKQQVAMGREMLWLRIDEYYRLESNNPLAIFQPQMCQHCENAPCEVVCPVEATLHDAGGLNLQVYNRCVGTRYCSNNCPYKVRRFNFLRYTESSDPIARLRYNPEVTVRERGVMEKCTYCLQRIARTQIEAQNEKREIQPGEIITACQAACPTQAIVFGDLNNPDESAAALRELPHSYSLLGELNTRPRTTYLARVENTNPRIEEASP